MEGLGRPPKTPTDSQDRWTSRALALLALVFGALSLVSFLRPTILSAPIGLSEGPPALWAELRAASGSFFGSTAVFFGMAARRPEWQGRPLGLAMLILGGFVMGRCLSILLDGFPSNPIAQGNLAVECVAFAVALSLWRRHRTRSQGPPAPT
jgi:hypothetical protein